MSSRGFSQLVQVPTKILDHCWTTSSTMVLLRTHFIDVVDMYYSDHDATYLHYNLQSPYTLSQPASHDCQYLYHLYDIVVLCHTTLHNSVTHHLKLLRTCMCNHFMQDSYEIANLATQFIFILSRLATLCV